MNPQKDAELRQTRNGLGLDPLAKTIDFDPNA